MDSKLEKVVTDLITGLGEKINSVEPIVGHGSVNQIFILTTNREKLIIRLNDDRGFDEYIKEKWCIENTIKLGVPGPTVLKIGEIDEYSYMIESFIEGVVGSKANADIISIWEQMGKYAKLINSIPVSGFGLESSELMDSNINTSQKKWEEFVTYNIDSLKPDDKLIELGALTEEHSKRVKELFENLILKQFEFGLNHGDLSLQNVMISDTGTVSIFDWGSAEAQIVPHHEIGVILEDSLRSESSEFKAFLNGYGLSNIEYKEIEDDIKSMMLLRAIDKLRWAIDKSPTDIPPFITRVKEFYKLKFE